MPRPGQPTKKPGAAQPGKFNNPLSNWLAARKDRRKNVEEQAARMITNKIEDNAAKLIDQLSSVDFINSKLPKEVLATRQNDNLPYCKLEYATKGLIQMIQNDRQSINVDIRPIDEKLMRLTLMFKQFVEHGDATAADMAKTALHRGIKEIRCKIPQNQPELADAFVEANAEYMEQWISLVEWAQVYDRQDKALADKRISHQKDEEKLEKRLDENRERLSKDPEYQAALYHMMNYDSPSERAKWTKLQRELHAAMIDDRVDQLKLEMSNLSLSALESKQSATKQKMGTLWNQLEEIPIVYDPNLLNKYRESMDKFLEQLAASDALMEDTINFMNELEGAFKQLDESAGAVLARETAAESAERLVKTLRDRQNAYSEQSAAERKRIQEELGIQSAEEIAAERERHQQEIDRELEAKVQKQRPKNTN